MTKTQFKALHRRIRMIAHARYVGTHGHLSDLVTEFGVTMQFCRLIRESGIYTKPERIIYGKYTTQYQDAQDQAAAWDAWGERRVGA